jgi:hypothetical protein
MTFRIAGTIVPTGDFLPNFPWKPWGYQAIQDIHLLSQKYV